MITITRDDVEEFMRKYYSDTFTTERRMQNAINRRMNYINEIISTPLVKSMVIKMEWKKSRTWGSNPHAEVWITYVNGETAYHNGYYVSGCGYDKTAQLICDILNENAIQNLIQYFDKDTEADHILNTYWSGEKGTFPRYSASDSAGVFHNYKCTHYAWGKMFDEYHIEFDFKEKE